MNTLFQADDVDAVLLIDASNSFIALNRTAALHNIHMLCPIIAAYIINTYTQPVRLFIVGGKEIASAEGTTQGDPLAMAFCVISTLSTLDHESAGRIYCEAMLVRRRRKWCWSCDANQRLH